MSPISGIDPRAVVVDERLSGVSRIIGVTGSKGGIGKSVVASLLALAFADTGSKVGLFDLDFTSPSDHVVLGVDRSFPEEEFGIDPHRVHGIAMMSVAFFIGDAPVPMRGDAATSALLELLAITRWGDLDVLVLDMPPGLGDTNLDVINLLKRVEFLLIGNGSQVVIESVRRALNLFAELNVPMVGLVENMRRGAADVVGALAGDYSVPFLGSIPYDADLESALGDVGRLRQTEVYSALAAIAADLRRPDPGYRGLR